MQKYANSAINGNVNTNSKGKKLGQKTKPINDKICNITAIPELFTLFI